MGGPRARRNGRKDLSQASIVAEAKDGGIEVFDVSAIGGLGFDIVCYDKAYDIWLPFEVKSNNAISKQSRAKRLQPSQVRAVSRAAVGVAETIHDIFFAFERARERFRARDRA